VKLLPKVLWPLPELKVVVIEAVRHPEVAALNMRAGMHGADLNPLAVEGFGQLLHRREKKAELSSGRNQWIAQGGEGYADKAIAEDTTFHMKYRKTGLDLHPGVVRKGEVIALHVAEGSFQHLFPAGQVADPAEGMVRHEPVPAFVLNRVYKDYLRHKEVLFL
jgi:hypothetical protein